jgi:hypothetical protein
MGSVINEWNLADSTAILKLSYVCFLHVQHVSQRQTTMGGYTHPLSHLLSAASSVQLSARPILFSFFLFSDLSGHFDLWLLR